MFGCFEDSYRKLIDPIIGRIPLTDYKKKSFIIDLLIK